MTICGRCKQELVGRDKGWLQDGMLLCMGCHAEDQRANLRKATAKPAAIAEASAISIPAIPVDLEKCSVCRRFIMDTETACVHDQRMVCCGCWESLNPLVLPYSNLVRPGGSKGMPCACGWQRNHRAPQPNRAPDEKSLTGIILNAWASATEREIGEIELVALKREPFGPQRHLLYALRISRLVEKLVNIDPLAAKWNIAYFGPDPAFEEGGLSGAYNSPDQRACMDFLTALYCWKLEDIIVGRTAKADLSAASRKSFAARANLWRKIAGEIAGWPGLFNPPLPGSTEIVRRLTGALEGRILAMEQAATRHK